MFKTSYEEFIPFVLHRKANPELTSVFVNSNKTISA